MAGKSLAVLSNNLDIATVDTLANILAVSAKNKNEGVALLNEYEFEATDGSEAQSQILDQILNATDDDELENIGGAAGWQNYLGIPMEIQGFHPAKSEKEGDGPPFYLLCDLGNVVTGDILTLSIGSWGVIGQLLNLAKRGKIPGAIRILTKGEETKAGRNPLKLISTQREIDERMAAKAKERL